MCTRAAFIDACHEAGHVIMARHLNAPIRSAFYCSFERKGAVESLNVGVFNAPILAAGYVAALRAADRKDSMCLRLDGFSDREKIQRLLGDYLSEHQLFSYVLKLEDDVAGFLYQPHVWELVVNFANELARNGSLDQQACMLLTQAVPRANLSEYRATMLEPRLHNHIGRRIGRSKLSDLETALRAAVARLNSAFDVSPGLEQLLYELVDNGYSEFEAASFLRPFYEFWAIDHQAALRRIAARTKRKQKKHGGQHEGCDFE